jgi:hypothetical protein
VSNKDKLLMKKQMKWGIATLILLLGIAAVFIFLDQNAELQQLEKETAESDKLRQEHNKPQETLGAVEELPPVVPPNEHPSGPHQHGNGTVHNPSVSQVSQTYTGPLTYHAELLETNPVKALRLQAEERGHVNAKWIPPFPPDDQEAQAFARNLYLSTYLDETDPEYEKAAMAWREQLRAINEKYPYGARLMDLSKLIWVGSSRTLSHYNRGGTAKSPSDYFPLHISDLK